MELRKNSDTAERNETTKKAKAKAEANAASEIYRHIVVINQSDLVFIEGEMHRRTAASNDTFLAFICLLA